MNLECNFVPYVGVVNYCAMKMQSSSMLQRPSTLASQSRQMKLSPFQKKRKKHKWQGRTFLIAIEKKAYILTDLKYAKLTSLYIFQKTVEYKLPSLG